MLLRGGGSLILFIQDRVDRDVQDDFVIRFVAQGFEFVPLLGGDLVHFVPFLPEVQGGFVGEEIEIPGQIQSAFLGDVSVGILQEPCDEEFIVRGDLGDAAFRYDIFQASLYIIIPFVEDDVGIQSLVVRLQELLKCALSYRGDIAACELEHPVDGLYVLTEGVL